MAVRSKLYLIKYIHIYKIQSPVRTHRLHSPSYNYLGTHIDPIKLWLSIKIGPKADARIRGWLHLTVLPPSYAGICRADLNLKVPQHISTEAPWHLSAVRIKLATIPQSKGTSSSICCWCWWCWPSFSCDCRPRDLCARGKLCFVRVWVFTLA